MRKQLGVCNLCEAICGLEYTIDAGRIVSVRGNPDDPLSRGHICPKAVALQDIYDDPDRLRNPVRRTSQGEWEPISWKEALKLAATKLADVQNNHGNDAVAVYLGNPNVHSLGAMTHGTQVASALRTKNTYSATSVDQLPHQLVSHLMYGHQLLIPVPDVDRTDFLLVFGANPMASNGSLMTVPDFPKRVRELKARGGKIVLFDPRRTETAKVATEHHFVRPGTDAFVLLAMLNVLFTEGLTTPPLHAEGVDALRAAVDGFTPDKAAEITGVSADVIRCVAREFAESGAAAAYGRIGVSTQAFGTICAWAVQCLNILTGNLDRAGGAMFTEPAIDLIERGLLSRGHFDKWRSRVRGLPEAGGELPVSTLADEILTPGDGQVRALVTIAGNPVLSTPDGKRLGDALKSLDFMVAVDYYINETTQHADLILPPTSALERNHYDLVFHLLAVRNTARFTPALFPKPQGARDDWEIFRDLALGVIHRRKRKPTLAKRLTMEVRLRLSPTLTVDGLLRTGQRKLSLKQLKAHPEGIDLGPLRPVLPGRLRTKDKRIQLAPQLLLDDLHRLAEVPVASEGDLVLIGRRHQRDCNSWMHNTERLTKGRPRHQLLINPQDLAARNLIDGESVTVTSRVGEVTVEVQATDDMMPGVVSLPHGYGHAAKNVNHLNNAEKLPGVSINDLTDPELLDVSGNAAFSGVPVRVTAAQ
ncbi:molybdopterin-dependent oxidoreductase [Hoyosella subflava]|uniref:Molybdopterin oxidoreductase n=1 Tax=Hoyosella subflava (strain DSM 45089 / JCM 17490 / NBRC 109087 / DQS3-9A1) TaxID=443218 RepID=F6EQJ8_HOYSD|nr:molybdopterin-dependent oxidoreductase [Hoyosella subflava]AEF41875.1 Molybdopterin oxidoreductase [Hoyosella subflava DQS3-9A1]